MDSSDLGPSRIEAIDRLGAHLLAADAPPEVRAVVAVVCAAALPVPPVPVAWSGPWRGLWHAWVRHAVALDAPATPRGDALRAAVAWARVVAEEVAS